MRTFLIVLLLQLFASAWLGCGKSSSEQASKQADAATEPAAAKSPEPLATFNPAMLVTSSRAADFKFTFPEMRVLLDDKAPFVVSTTIVAECADAKTQKELKSRFAEIRTEVTETLCTKRPQYICTTAGKMRTKEEILARIRAKLENKGIRDIYFLEFSVAPGVR